jgi:hypothetical protein
MIIFLTFGVGQVHADNVNDVYVQNIKIQPSTIKVGDAFIVTITLVNNSTVPVWLDGGKCSSADTNASFFTVIFDNHAKIKAKDINCAGVGWSQKLDPGKNNTATSPDYTVTYIATEPGTANATMTFSYHVINQTDPAQPGFSQNISKSFLFTILDNNTGTKMLTETILSPLKQFKSGISANNVTCNQGLELIFKSEDNSPACVKYNTAPKLTEQGWALTRLTIAGLKETYGVGEKISFIIDFQGLLHYCDYPQVSVLDSNQNTVWKSQDIISMCVSDLSNPLPYVSQNFDLNSGYGGPIIINKAGNYTMKVSLEGNSVEKEFTVESK